MKRVFTSLMMLALALSANAQSVTLTPDKDNSIYSENSANSNGVGQLFSGTTCGSSIRRALMHFDVSSIPSNATITSVTLTLVSTQVGGSAGTEDYNIYGLTSSFGEGTSSGLGTGAAGVAPDATWSHAELPSTTWTNPGGDYSGTAISSLTLPGTTGTHTFPTSTEFVSLVQGWLNTPASNHGVILLGDESTNCTARRFGSKDQNTAPVLEVNYTVPCVTPPTAVCQNIDVYLDATGNATINASDLDGGSIDNCSTSGLVFSASQTAFTCADVTTGGAPSPNEALIISGVYDGPLTGGTPKGVELYVKSDIADLSSYGLGSANNGGGTDGEEFTFPAVSATAGSYIYVTNDSLMFIDFFGSSPDYVSGAMSINGDDAIELFYSGAVVDVFGDINVDGSGQTWDYLDGWAYRDNNVGVNGGTFNDANWTYSGINIFDGLSTNSAATPSFPIGTYTYATGTGVSVTLTVTDGSGNSADCIAFVNVLDTIAPTASALQPINIECATDLPAADSLLITDEADNCTAAPMVNWVGDVSDNMSCPETITRTYSIEDESGNTTNVTQTIIIEDVTNPVPDTAMLADISTSCDVTPMAPTATDNCDGALTGVSDVMFPIVADTDTTITITWTYADACGNVETQTQNVVITVLEATAMATDTTLVTTTTGDSYQWIDCSDNSPIAGETGMSMTLPANGEYAVVVTIGACSDTSDCIVINDNGLFEFSKEELSVYPNPSNGKFVVDYDGNISNVTAVDLLGREVELTFNVQTGEVEMKDLVSGEYILFVTNEKKQVAKLMVTVLR